jgi:hypothetical protein
MDTLPTTGKAIETTFASALSHFPTTHKAKFGERNAKCTPVVNGHAATLNEGPATMEKALIVIPKIMNVKQPLEVFEGKNQ